MAGASVAGVLGRVAFGESLAKLDDSAVVVAVARVVAALHLAAGGASAGVAVLLSRLADSQFHALVLAFARDWVVLAGNL